MLGHKNWILAWQGDCTCINSILFVPNIVSPFDIHVLEQIAMKGKGFLMTFIKNYYIFLNYHVGTFKPDQKEKRAAC